ncbi:MAG: DUF434 domain-containing protein [Candidatus Asgardarchaeia archaeon]
MRRGVGYTLIVSGENVDLKLLRLAAEDLVYLLSRGYRKDSALKFISDHYNLGKISRYILARGIYPDDYIREVSKKVMKEGSLKGEEVFIDGYNVLITVEAIISGLPLFMGNDGIVRDVRCVFGKYRMSEKTRVSLKAIVDALKEMEVSSAHFLYDGQVSKSGILSSITREVMKEVGLNGSSETSKDVDKFLRGCEGVVCTSDSGIIKYLKKLFDLSGYLSKRQNANVIKILG